MLQGNFVKIFNSTQTFKNVFFVLKVELILIIGSNKVLTEGARKVYRGRRVGQGCSKPIIPKVLGIIDLEFSQSISSVGLQINKMRHRIH
jgi:hypothetical protein